MITIQVLGLDQFVVGRYSRENTGNLAQVFECEEKDVSFYAPNSMIFHNGVEQTSWNTLVRVLAPKKFAIKEKEVADFLLKTMTLFTINLQVIFEYYDEANRYVFLNKEYPEFITMNEIRDDAASMQFGDVPDVMEGEEDDEVLCPGFEGETPAQKPEEGDGEIFLGNAFEGFEEAYDEATKNRNN